MRIAFLIAWVLFVCLAGCDPRATAVRTERAVKHLGPGTMCSEPMSDGGHVHQVTAIDCMSNGTPYLCMVSDTEVRCASVAAPKAERL